MTKIELGKTYKTVGNWDALVIHILFSEQHFYAVHKPNTEEESNPILHSLDGKALTAFSVNERPCYGKHPADILCEGEE